MWFEANLWRRWLARTFSSNGAMPRVQSKRRQPTYRPLLEELEDRTVPTLLFQPQFGAESAVNEGGAQLGNAPIYLFFWGSYWHQSAQNVALAQNITSSIQTIIDGRYLEGVADGSNITGHGITQYGGLADGTPYLAQQNQGNVFPVFDYSNPPANFSNNTLQNQATNDGIPQPTTVTKTAARPIYVMITPPNITSTNEAGASNNQLLFYLENLTPEVFPMIWLGGQSSAGAPNLLPGQSAQSYLLGQYTGDFSHELAESITDIGTNNNAAAKLVGLQEAIHVNHAALWDQITSSSGSNQIADTEAQDYSYRLGGSTLVQSYWSQLDKQYVINDGTYQNFELVGQFGGATANIALSAPASEALTVTGDQYKSNLNDAVTVNTIASGLQQGGLEVTENGETVQFDPGQISSLTIKLGLGANTIDVENLPANVALTIDTTGIDTIAVHSLPASASVRINNINGHDAVTYGSDGFPTLSTIQGNVLVDGNNHTVLTFIDSAGPAGTTYQITPTSLSRPSMGTFTEYGTTGLTLLTSQGSDDVVVAAGDHELPAVTINGSGDTALEVDTLELTPGTYFGVNGSTVTTTNFQDAYNNSVQFNGVDGLTVNTGPSANNVQVGSTVVPTTIVDPAATAVITVGSTIKDLDGITSPLFITGSGSTTVVVNDQARPSSTTLYAPQYTLSPNGLQEDTHLRFQRIGSPSGNYQTALIDFGGVGRLHLNMSNLANNLDVEGTPGTTIINPGTGATSINLTPVLQQLDNIVGTLIVTAASKTTLNIYDQANDDSDSSGQPNVYTVGANAFTRTSYAVGDLLPWVSTVDYGSLAGINLWTAETADAGGVFTNQVQVNGTPSGTTPLAIQAGEAGDQINVSAPVVLGAHVMGNLIVNGQGADLILDDSATQDITDQTNSVTYTSTAKIVTFSDLVTTTAPGRPHSTATLGWALAYSNLQNLAIDGGPASSAFKVQSTASGTPVAVTAGSAGASFSVGLNDSVKNIRSLVSLTGIGTQATLVIDDSTSTAQDRVTLSNGTFGHGQVGMGATDQFFGSGGGLVYGYIISLTVNLSNAASDAVQLTPSGTVFSINGKAAQYKAGKGAVLSLNQTGVTNAKLTDVAGTGQWTFGNRATVSFSNMLMGKGIPTVQVSDAGGTANGQPFPATATVTGSNGTPGSSLEGVSLTLDYQLLNATGSVMTDLGPTAPSTSGSYAVIASFAGSTDYAPATAHAAFTISPANLATPTVQVSDAGGTYNGQPFPATATVTGSNGTSGSALEGVSLTLDYQLLNADGSVMTDLGSTAPSTAGSYAVIASFVGSTDYAPASNRATFTISPANLATPTVQVSDAGGTYSGQSFPATATVTGSNGTPGSTLEGVGLTLDYQLMSGGTVQSDLGATAPTNAGSYQVIASFAGSPDYASATSQPTPFTIGMANPVIIWNNPAPIPYGTPLSATQLNWSLATSLPGSFQSGPTVGTILNAGTQSLTVYFVPADQNDYYVGIQTVQLVVNPATPTIQVSAPGGTFNGQTFAATATVAGVIAGVDNTPSSMLENVPLTYDYQVLNADGSVETDLGSSAPSNPGSYRVIVSFAGSLDYLSGTALADFAITKGDF